MRASQSVNAGSSCPLIGTADAQSAPGWPPQTARPRLGAVCQGQHPVQLLVLAGPLLVGLLGHLLIVVRAASIAAEKTAAAAAEAGLCQQAHAGSVHGCSNKRKASLSRCSRRRKPRDTEQAAPECRDARAPQFSQPDLLVRLRVQHALVVHETQGTKEGAHGHDTVCEGLERGHDAVFCLFCSRGNSILCVESRNHRRLCLVRWQRVHTRILVSGARSH